MPAVVDVCVGDGQRVLVSIVVCAQISPSGRDHRSVCISREGDPVACCDLGSSVQGSGVRL